MAQIYISFKKMHGIGCVYPEEVWFDALVLKWINIQYI